MGLGWYFVGRSLKAIDRTRLAAKHMTMLIESLQKLTQIDSNAYALHKEPSDLAVIAEEVFYLVEALADEKGIRMTRSLQPCPGDYDIKQMRQVVLNRLSNAVKYSRPGDSVSLAPGPTEPLRKGK